MNRSFYLYYKCFIVLKLMRWHVKVQKFELFPWWEAVKGSTSAVQKIPETIVFIKKINKNNMLVFFEKKVGLLGTSLAM